MKSKNVLSMMLVAVFALTSLAMIPLTGSQAKNVEGNAGATVLFSIPEGEEGIRYAVSKAEEGETFGPASLRIAADGTFLIADTVGNRILRYRQDGSNLDAITVADSVSITDVAASDSSIFALDEAAIPPAVIRLAADGTIKERIDLPSGIRSQGLSGISTDSSGRLMTETRGAVSTALTGGPVTQSKTAEPTQLTVQAPDLNDKTADHSEGTVLKNGTLIRIKVANTLGSLSVIAHGPDGDFFILVEELSNTRTLYVDQTVRHYSADGHLLGIARVPVSERYTYVAHGVAVAPDGNVYALVTRPDRADVVRLAFKPQLESILPAATDLGAQAAPDVMTAVACTRTRDQMINTAWTYVNNQTYLTTTNLNGYCAGRIKPRYLGSTAGYYYSVPYCWGGWELPGDFNNRMTAGNVAGDINDSRVSSCPHGDDCSGFVSRCWGTSTKYSTSTLPGISTEISVSQAQRGDILNLSGSHVVMIESIVSNGVMTLEATAYNAYDRVVYIYNGWSRFGGYRFYRYNNVCDSAGQGRPVVSSSLTLSSGGPYYVGQTLYAYFTIANRGSQPITLSRLLVGGRLNGDTSCSGGCPDFSSVYNITLSPSQSYSYSGSRYLDRAGTYSFFVAYQKTDGTWVTNVETENGAVNSRSITVQNQQVSPSLSSYSPNPLYARSYNQTVYFYGQRLANTTAMYVYFPNGGAAYIYPPYQITGRSYSTLQTYITLSGRGWYTFYAYTSDGGWSNGYSVWVN